ncbi:hypothetical protein [Nostoc sp.]
MAGREAEELSSKGKDTTDDCNLVLINLIEGKFDQHNGSTIAIVCSCH